MTVPKTTLWQDIKWKLFMLKLDLSMASMERKNRHLRRRYCRHGIHKITHGHVEHWGSDTTHRRVDFLKCAFCNYMFFATKEDKAWYQKRY